MSFILSSDIFSGILSLFIMSSDVLAGIWPFLACFLDCLVFLPSDILPSDILPPDILPSGILPSDILPSDILSPDILSWATWSSFILSWAIAAVARPNTIISVVSCFFIVVLVVFNTELLRAVAALARVAGLALILHNAPAGPEQISHMRKA